jgi:hypothetical protein
MITEMEENTTKESVIGWVMLILMWGFVASLAMIA